MPPPAATHFLPSSKQQPPPRATPASALNFPVLKLSRSLTYRYLIFADVQQGEGGLVGVGASASAAPGPLTGSVMGFANPTGASAPSASAGASGSSSSGSAARPSSTANTTSGASSIAVDLFLALLASLAGFALA